jgi:hypothetical protein
MKYLFYALAACGLFVTVSGTTPLADFDERIAAFMKIHKAAEAEAGRLSATQSSKELDGKEKSLRAAIVAKRAGAAQGDIFTPAIAAEFRRLIAINLKHRSRAIRESIRSGELVAGTVHVNDTYPEKVPLETMPPTLLASFPQLPPELDYRFIGSTLVLRDAGENLILDLIPNALPQK